MENDQVRVGVVGYGAAYNMGKYHLDGMRANPGFVPTAVCDTDAARLEAARTDFPGIETYSDLDAMLAASKVQLLAVILPHNLHASVTVRCLEAGRHVVVEKPFALTVEECDAMLQAAEANGVMLSCFHNRHWDANILTIMKHLPRIGRPYRWESHQGSHQRPRDWWRSDKAVSGGLIYDWGAHYVEWMLQVMGYDIERIDGFRLDEVWREASNEDEVEAIVHFKGDAIGSHTATSVACAGKPAIRICGTGGTIIADHQSVTVHTVEADGSRVATEVPMEARAGEQYYRNVHDHLLADEDLLITPQWARRVIQVLDCAGRAAATGESIAAKYA